MWQLVVVGLPHDEQLRVVRMGATSSKLIGQEGN
jgi:hypothetical protein